MKTCGVLGFWGFGVLGDFWEMCWRHFGRLSGNVLATFFCSCFVVVSVDLLLVVGVVGGGGGVVAAADVAAAAVVVGVAAVVVVVAVIVVVVVAVAVDVDVAFG